MPQPSQTFDEALTQAWQTLERRLRLLQRFAYIVYFVRDGLLAEGLKKRVAQWLADREWVWADVAEQGAEDFSQRSLTSLFEQLREGGRRLAWLEAHRGGGQSEWDEQRHELLSRLNERRGRLENELPGAFILLLPEDGLRHAASLAPDLWHVRLLSATLRADAESAPAGVGLPQVRGEPPSAPADAVRSGSYWSEQWRALFGHTAPEDVAGLDERLAQLSLYDAFANISNALNSGRPDLARQLAEQILGLARRRLALSTEADERSRLMQELSTSLNLVGDAALRQGDLERARLVYQESLATLMQFAPQSLRELALVLDRVGHVEQAQGRLDAAMQAYGESLRISRALVSGGSAQAMRDLLVSLNNVGEVALRQGHLAQAAAVYEESLNLSRADLPRQGGSPQAMRDLSIALDRFGQVLEAQRDMSRAAAVYAEGLSLTRELAKRMGDTPETLRDLVISLNSVSRVARAQADWVRARAVNEESLQLARQCVQRWPESPQAHEDLAITLAEASWRPDSKGDALLREAEQILTDLVTRYPDVASYRHRLDTLRSWIEARMPQNNDSPKELPT